MKILIAGSSGLIGSELVAFLIAEGHQVFRLVRRTPKNPQEIYWDPKRQKLDAKALESFDAIINLAGDTIFQRWSAEGKRNILESRIQSAKLLAETIGRLQRPPTVFINASAIGYYGDTGANTVSESSPVGSGFLAEVCQEWEKVASVQECRTVLLRIGVVFTLKGGALRKMVLPFKWGLGGKLGLGTQTVSWIAIDDLLAIIQKCLTDVRLSGPVNAVSPDPVTNAELTQTLGKVLHRPTFFTTPAVVLRLVFGKEMANEVLLVNSRVIPEKLREVEFVFNYPKLEDALKHLLT